MTGQISDDLTIIIQSTDSFSDCWEPFFTLFQKYWSTCHYPIILNTETKNFSHSSLNIRTSQIMRYAGSKWPSWSKSLLLCLDLVETDIVLFMIDDFFVSGEVEVEALYRFLQIMIERDYSNITLTEHGYKRPTLATENPLLLAVHPRAKYRVTTSPALWRKETLRSYLRAYENAWEFEIYGSRRAWKRPDSFFIANPDLLKNGTEGIIPYFQGTFDTGIVKGKWQPQIKTFFESHNIRIDYSDRGFYHPLPGVPNRYFLMKKLLVHPLRFVRGIFGC